MAEEPLTLAVHVGAGHPRVILARAHLAHGVTDEAELLECLLVRVAVKLHVHAAGEALWDVGQVGKAGPLRALGAQDAQGPRVEVLNRRRLRETGPRRNRDVERGRLRLKEAAHAPHHSGRRHQGKLYLRDDAQSAVRANEQVEGVHVVRHVVARGVLGVRHLVAGKIEHKRAAALSGQGEGAALRMRLAAPERQHVSVRQHHAQGAHVRASGAVAVAAGAGGVAGNDAAQAGGRLRWVGGEELLGAVIERVERREAPLVPARRGHRLVHERLAQVREHHARLYAQVEGAVLTTAKA